MEIMAENALLKPFRMASVVRGSGSVVSTLPERVNGRCPQPNASDGGALQTLSTTMLSSGRVPASVSKPSLFLTSQLQERATATNTL